VNLRQQRKVYRQQMVYSSLSTCTKRKD